MPGLFQFANRNVYAVLMLVLGVLAGFLIGFQAREQTPVQAVQVSVEPTGAVVLAFDASPKPDIPTLQDITARAQTDREAVHDILAYYDTHHDHLAAVFQETNETRLRALFVMYTLHISHDYDVVETPADTLLGYLRRQPASHCGWFSQWGQVLNEAFGLESRIVALYNGDHGWNEVKVDGHWESFDPTTNLWLSEPGEALVKGVSRQYRAFYTPLLDINLPAARRSYYESSGHWDVVSLRQSMIGLGIYYHRNSDIIVLDVEVQRPEG